MDTPGVATTPFYDAFISYGRPDSKAFATQLYQRLIDQGFTVWFDQNDIPLGVDFQAQIDDGLEKAHNVLFIISPHSVNSPYCGKEINLALRRNKRILPLLHVEQISRETWQSRNPNGTDEQWAEDQAKGLHSSHPNMHPEIGKINWVYFREGIDDFEPSLKGLVEIFQRHRGYVEQHTTLLAQALEWESNQKQTRYLLVGEDRLQAEQWLQHRFKEEQPPCEPTLLHCEFICESIKNANNLMTQLFLAHAEADGKITEQIRESLLRQGITVWISKLDIQTGETFEAAIDRGIEQANTIVYLLSPAALQSAYCQRELDYALRLNKRIIPLRIQPTELEQIPAHLRSLQFIDFTDNETQADQQDVDQLLKVLREDTTYYEEHKILLTQALKWERQSRNPTILLRGYNLRRAEDWLKGAHLRSQHPPTELQETFIHESLRQPPAASLDVFISYSRADSELARRLNEELQLRGKTTWFDQESIASGADFQQEIYRGIEGADNFLFVLSPRAVNSPYCADEVEYATKLNKRFVTLLYRPVNTANLHPELANVQWIDFTPSGGDFTSNMNRLVRTLETDREHVRNHTKWSLRSLEWKDKDRSEDLLLRGSERVAATAWLQQAIQEHKQPPPTDLQQMFIAASQAWHERSQNQERERQQKELEQALKAKKAAQRTVVGAIAFSVMVVGLAIYAYGQQQRAEQQTKIAQQQTKIAQVREQAAGVTNFLLTNSPAEALVLAIDTLNQSQELPIVQSVAQASLLSTVQVSQEVNRLRGHEDSVLSVAFSPDGRRILSGSGDNTLRIWDAATGKPIGQPIKGHQSWVSSVAFSPDGTRILSGSGDNTLRIWDAATGKPIGQPIKGHQDAVLSIAFSPDGKRILSGSFDKTIRIWDAATGKLIGQPITGHQNPVRSVAFSPDGRHILSGSDDNTLRIWDAATGKPIGQPIKGHQSWVRSVAFSPDGRHILSGSDDNTLRIWDAATGKPIGQPIKGHQNPVRSVAFSPDGRRILSGSFDNTLRIWDAATGKPIGQPIKGHQNPVLSVTFSPDGKRFLSGSGDKMLRIWDATTGQPIGQPITGHESSVSAVAFSPDGKRFLSGSFDKTIRIWDAATGQPIGQPIKGHEDAVFSVTFSPDGTRFLSGSGDKMLRIWDATTGQPIGQPITGHEDLVRSVAFSPDGKRFLSGSFDKTIRIWDAATGQPIGQPIKGHKEMVLSVVFSPDGTRFLSGSADQTLQLWDAATGKPIGQPITGHESSVSAVAFSPDGRRFLSGSLDNTLQLWDAATGKPIGQPITGHKDAVNSVAFSPDSKRFLSGSANQTLQLWDAATGQPIGQPLKGHEDAVNSVAFSPDGKHILSGSDDQTLRIWDVSPEKLLAVACDRLRYHPLLNQPETLTNDPEFLQVAQRARAACQQQVWKSATSAAPTL